ncbi:LysR family transcriptional regulator [Clostridium cochlearium]|uniref:LysR family transcriptional regulator n=1 Tax=Clostridium cochlearium TaxID=1494 RepID=UPI000B948ADF|nr:LysR family transcriptional regulator [Clostridium cochlearium]MBV1820192.1 LysR family transcriptional regulator [Bacteroidales bacterium MSK.15.36]NSJ92339.1 LysR family transcriptional regulator [Coprococcus sp. MSK.21.13]MCG4572347.1 LysR family transcriptional regulator [Clostridium cochlearium]MCR1970792.1 LysR family transcriptional regulator [Clostridium cochlearium]NME96424.1 LysR family transcriptional regulator [Clostridium cochlearium]
MNLEYLQSFYVTVKSNSISKAAENLHLTQPGLSMQLKNLEKELGVTLLNRSNKGVEMTEEGKVVFDYAHTILDIKGNIERDLKSLHETVPTLIIGSCKSVGEYALPCSIYTFKKFNKDIDIHMQIDNSEEVIKKLCDHTINIGIVQKHPENNSISTKTIISDELVLVGSAYNDKNKISLEELRDLPLILREEGSGTREIILNSLEEKNIDLRDLNVIYNLNSPEAIKSSISSDKGFSFLPKLIINKELKKNYLKQIDIDELKIDFKYYLIYRKNYRLTSYEKRFVDFIISSKRGFC